MSIAENPAKNIDFFRRDRGLSQEKLAELAELDRTYISMLEGEIKSYR